MPSVTVVLLSHHFQSLQPYSAVETGTTFFSLPSFIFMVLPPSLAKPGTSAGAGGGRLNVYDAIRSSVVQSATLRARSDSWPALGLGWPLTKNGPWVLGVCGLIGWDCDSVRLRLSSSYCPVQCTIAPISKPCIHVSAGPS